MALKIGTHSFHVESATLNGIVFDKSWKKFDPTINNGIHYSLYVKCEPQVVDGEQWRPTLEFDRFALDATSWPEIENASVTEIEGSAFTALHCPALLKKLAFGKRTGRRFAITMDGTCDRWQWSFKGPVSFEGYIVNGTIRDNEEKLASRLEAHVQLLGLETSESVVKDYIPRKKMRTKFFTPAARVTQR